MDVNEASVQDKTEGEWYFNTVTKSPELGKISPMDQRLGPYRSYEEAERAWEKAGQRNVIWDEENRKWDAWGGGDDRDRGV
ncbi:hypothetical protein FHX77_000004 [Bifidobacterium commune]|uniref:SPOR domain-containing protein n=1 Tax=Bifidobacterium commune TaxID=1505727 RepID=A0A1C4H0N0_9BIFI|nr:hypothetical protein [Bifidobacterium commune]SCC78426.1 hypothetical protein GA0061077_0255 [Bifidobacterium commune]